jgi:hypothetical protein
MMNEGKPFKRAAPWNPGKYGHELIADILAYEYGSILRNSIQKIKD